jgi:hypothetical protein
MIKSVCVFCGAQYGKDPRYRAAAEAVGALCGASGIELVYGGGHVGLMGAAADAAMAAGGRVVGLIPERLLAREVGHRAISELIVTESMFDRKCQMITRADAFLVLPGGLGTLDELLEVVTLRQLGYHDKPVILLNLAGYWDPFLALMERAIEARFAAADTRRLVTVIDMVDQILPALGLPAAAAQARAAAG